MIKILIITKSFNPRNMCWDNDEEWIKETTERYEKLINGWTQEQSENFNIDFVIADNTSTKEIRDILVSLLKKNSHIIFTDKYLTGWQAVNHALLLFKEKEDYDYIIVTNSDIIPIEQDTICHMICEMLSNENKDNVILAPQVDLDMGEFWPHLNIYDENKKPTTLNIPDSCSEHFYLFDKLFMEAYDYRLPDVLHGCRTGSFFIYLTAAIQKNFIMSHKIKLNHYKKDVLMKKFEKNVGTEAANPQIDKPLHSSWDTFLAMVKKVNDIAGFGFSEINPPHFCTVNHNPKFFMNKRYAITDDLYTLLKENLFLTKKQINYSVIEHTLKNYE